MTDANGIPWRSETNPWLIAAAMILPTFMVALDTSVANVSLPYIAGSLSSSLDQATWVLTSYLVANAIILPVSGWISQVLGRKRFLTVSMVVFTVASFLSGAALSLNMLIVARVIQGASGGALLPISQAVLLESFPPEKRSEAMAVYAFGVIVAPVVGPTLGGWITDTYSWRWVFYINLPVCLLAIELTRLLIEDPPHLRGETPKSVDYLGFGLMALGLGALQVVLDRGERADWFASNWVWLGTLFSAACLAGFVIRELDAKEPIVELRVLTDRNFAVGFVLATVYGFILYGTLVMLPLFLENLMGYTALNTGLAITPRGMGALVSVTLAGRYLKRIDSRIVLVVGLTLLATALFILSGIDQEISIFNVVWPNVLMGFAIGMVFVVLTTLAVSTLPNEMMGTATGLYNLMRGMGGSIGIAAITTFQSRNAQFHQSVMVAHLTPYTPAFQMAYHRLTQLFRLTGDCAGAKAKAYQAITSTLAAQSSVCAFLDNWRMLGFLALSSIPVALLFKKAGPKKNR
ncbi:MAG: DHA2 family efflux MFS transporter permease subunit [Syntrophobacteraceae bacterium]|nr:DHA2 family efflux MFS transporter permease subunit [Syntrophobacteraceae bacterium]